MFAAILDIMLGTIGRPILAFYMQNQFVINLVILVWAAVVTYGSLQLSKIRKMTVSLGVKALKETPDLSDEEIWESFRPKWEETLAKLNLKLMLNRHNIWLTKATPDNIIDIMRLSPEWFTALRQGEILRHKGALPGEEYHVGEKTRSKTQMGKKK